MAEKTYAQKMQDMAEQQGLGRDLSKLRPSKYRELALAVRPRTERVRDAGRAVVSRGLTAIGLRVIPEHIASNNAAICRACPDGLFIQLADGSPACNGCNCSDKYLEAKWKDRTQKCPKGHWNNRTVQMGDGEGTVPVGPPPIDGEAKGVGPHV